MLIVCVSIECGHHSSSFLCVCRCVCGRVSCGRVAVCPLSPHRSKAGEWGTSSGVEAGEGSGRANAAMTSLCAEFEPKLQQVYASFQARMQSLLAVLAHGETE